jgi:hypothetical protein
MSTDRDTTRIVRSWLRTAEHESADRVLDAVLDRLDATPQRRATWWPARRFPEMNNSAKLALAAAAVVVAAFLGIRFLGLGPNVGGPEATPTPTPTDVALQFPQPTALAPGTYYWGGGPDSARFTFTIPDGWTNRNDIIRKDRGEPGEVALGLWIPANTYVDPCHWQTSLLDPPVGPTVEDLATALTDQVGRNASAPTDVVVGGYPATKIELSVPADLDISTCDNGFYRDWLGEGELHSQDPIIDLVDRTQLLFRSGQVNVVYILDVEGTRWVINTWHMPDASEANLAELEAILASVRIEP